MRDSTAKRLSALHTWLFRLSGGRVGKRLVDNDMLLLTTHGRKTGRRHTVPLLYLTHGEALVVIASWGGRDYSPDWFHNLVAEPMATVRRVSGGHRVLARVAGGPERRELWDRAVGAYRGYADYQSRTDREIPIVILEPLQ